MSAFVSSFTPSAAAATFFAAQVRPAAPARVSVAPRMGADTTYAETKVGDALNYTALKLKKLPYYERGFGTRRLLTLIEVEKARARLEAKVDSYMLLDMDNKMKLSFASRGLAGTYGAAARAADNLAELAVKNRASKVEKLREVYAARKQALAMAGSGNDALQKMVVKYPSVAKTIVVGAMRAYEKDFMITAPAQKGADYIADNVKKARMANAPFRQEWKGVTSENKIVEADEDYQKSRYSSYEKTGSQYEKQRLERTLFGLN